MDIQTGGKSDTEETRPKKGPRCDSHSHHDPLKKVLDPQISFLTPQSTVDSNLKGPKQVSQIYTQGP